MIVTQTNVDSSNSIDRKEISDLQISTWIQIHSYKLVDTTDDQSLKNSDKAIIQQYSLWRNYLTQFSLILRYKIYHYHKYKQQTKWQIIKYPLHYSGTQYSNYQYQLWNQLSNQQAKL